MKTKDKDKAIFDIELMILAELQARKTAAEIVFVRIS
jgi:hypothetical protein